MISRNHQLVWKFDLISYRIFLVFCILPFFGANGDRTNTKIYEPITGALACFRRLNGSHQSGCSSTLNGDVGVVHLVSDAHSLDWVVTTGPHAPYIAVLYPEDFTRDYMMSFENSGRVNGVLVLKENTTHSTDASHFSSESSCPNEGYGLYNRSSSKNCKWNQVGTGMMLDNWHFPVFFIHEIKEAQSVVDCYETFNKEVNGTPREWPLCAAQLQSFMLGAVDAPTCIRRSKVFTVNPGSTRVCDPLGDLNIWSTLLPSNHSAELNSEGSVIVIGARMDSSSMFDKLAPGADSAASGIVTLLTVIKQLAENKTAILDALKVHKVKNVYFILFNGEAFDYIGSSRIVYDIMLDRFPQPISDNSSSQPSLLRLQDIKYFIEIGQVALNTNEDEYFIHRNWDSSSSNETSILVEELKKQGTSLKLKIKEPVSKELGLPPSSFQSFLAEKQDIPGIVIANHEVVFKNKFYNSIFDDAVKLGFEYKNEDPLSVQKKIASLAATIVNTVTNLMIGVDFSVEPDSHLVDELLYCYTTSAKCPIFQNISGHDQLPDFAYPLYIGVHEHLNPVTILTKNVMAYLQGTIVSKTEEKCSYDPELPNVGYLWINGSCYETTVKTSEARSPAFLEDNYDWKIGKYSTWTESVWQKFSVRIFLKPSLKHELLTLSFGIAVLVVSFITIGWVSSKSDIIFSSRYRGYTPVPPD